MSHGSPDPLQRVNDKHAEELLIAGQSLDGDKSGAS